LDNETRGFGGKPRATVAGRRRYAHHLAHAAYASWGSPFDEATASIVDGMGETGAAAIYRSKDGRIEEVRRQRGRGSVGFLYGSVTDLAGFDQIKGEEWKIMGLAPYGRTDPDSMAISRRLYTVEDGRSKFADEATVQAVAAEISSRRPSDV
ncbi:hypothetical protein OY671_012389, partial [Metschnikowia pulcherrima]